jgi:hypothetical protein
MGGRNQQGGAAYGSERAGGEAGRGPGDIDPRQWQREMEERLREIQGIRQGMGRDNPLVGDLDRAIRGLQNAIRSRTPGDPAEIERLAQQIIDPLRSVELELSRALQLIMAKDNIRSIQEDEIPSDYRKLVEEYYKKLGGPKKNQ